MSDRPWKSTEAGALAEEILVQARMLTVPEFSARSGIDEGPVMRMILDGRLLAIRNGRYGYCCPAWQLHDDVVLDGMADVISLCGDDLWMAYCELVAEYPDGGREAVHQHLRRGRKSEMIEHVRASLAFVGP